MTERIFCRTCQVGKPATSRFYYRDRYHRSGFKTQCIECMKDENLARYYASRPVPRIRELKMPEPGQVEKGLRELEKRTRYGNPVPVAEIAEACGVSKAAIYKIEKDALRKFRLRFWEVLKELEESDYGL